MRVCVCVLVCLPACVCACPSCASLHLAAFIRARLLQGSSGRVEVDEVNMQRSSATAKTLVMAKTL